MIEEEVGQNMTMGPLCRHVQRIGILAQEDVCQSRGQSNPKLFIPILKPKLQPLVIVSGCQR